jgi:UDP-N-acetylmuramate dehydrogenase
VLFLSAPAFGEITVSGRSVTAGGGAKLSHVISTAVREGLAGLETLVGIPGTVGAALRGNVDAGSGDLGQWTSGATVMSRSGEIRTRARNDLRFAYRQSNLDELVILSGTFELEEGDPQELTKRLQKLWIVKKASQPQGKHTVASLFKDVGGVSAATLIEQAGLKMAHVGRAQVCEHNANFVVAGAGASSSEVLDLIELLRNSVAERLGVELVTQLEIW